MKPIDGGALPGRRMGEYLLEGELARGAVTVVYRARPVDGGEAVALRVFLNLSLMTTPRQRELCLLELARWRGVQHPGLAALGAPFEHQGHLVVPQELVSGEPLDEVVRREGPLPWEEAAAVALGLARALDQAHRRQALVGSLGPRDVLLEPEGGARLILRGLPAHLPRDSLCCGGGAIVGDLAFMSPEAAAGWRADARAEVWSVGALLFLMLTGRPPEVAPTQIELIRAKLERSPAPPSHHRRRLPPALDRLVEKALAPLPTARFATCDELAGALRDLLFTGEVAAASPARPRWWQRVGRALRGERPVSSRLWSERCALPIGRCLRCSGPPAGDASGCPACLANAERGAELIVSRGGGDAERVALWPAQRATIGPGAEHTIRAACRAELRAEPGGGLTLTVRRGAVAVDGDPVGTRRSIAPPAEVDLSEGVRLRVRVLGCPPPDPVTPQPSAIGATSLASP